MDAVLLARLQFGLTICFHFIFPLITIGMAWLLVVIEGVAWRQKDQEWERLGQFFGKLFAITFAVGVATGVVMEFQFGTNWASYSAFVGDIFGAPLAAEGIFAFFLESTFFGLYLFGRGRVSKGLHWFSILMVAVGATISAFWIIVANSWQQTPDGYVLQNGRAELTSFYQAVFNPSTLPRYFHTMAACIVCGAFFMAGISAYLIRKQKDVRQAHRSLKLSLGFGLVGGLMSIYPTGHHHAVEVAYHQPAKFAAMEGLYTEDDGAMVLFAFPTTRPPTLHAEIEVPGLLRFLTGKEAKPLSEFPDDERPHGAELWITFVSFHTMVGLGTLFVLLTGFGLWRLRRQPTLDPESKLNRRWLLLMVIAMPLPVFASELGWMVAEVGRQPWIVQGILRTDEGASITVSAGEILASIIMFGVVYLFLGALWIYLIYKHVNKGVPAPAAAVKEGY